MKRRVFNFAGVPSVMLLAFAIAATHAGCRSPNAGRDDHAVTQPAQRSEPFRLNLASLKPDSIGFTWTAVPGAHQYKIEISADGKDFFGSSLIEPGLMDYEFAGFDRGESFIFRAVAVDRSGADIAVSNLVPVTLPPAK